MEGKTSTGFNYVVADDANDDMELLDALIELDEDKPAGLKHAMTALLGNEQKASLYEHCRVNGHVKASKVMQEFKEIMDNLPKEIKN